MKKISFLFIFLVSGLFIFSGCANENNVNNKMQLDDFRRPDFGQPERRSDVRGLVKSITGNEIVILKIDRPEMNDDKNEGDHNNATIGQGMGRMPGMGMRKSGSEQEQAQILEKMKSMATGEEKIIIPVGIQMLMANSVDEKDSPLEASLADIKKDKMIQVWLDENISDRNIADFVMIMK